MTPVVAASIFSPPVRAFACPHCHRQVFFENTRCLNCGTAIGFDPLGRTIARAGTYCANREIAGCNWLVERDGELCASCRLTRTRPADGDAEDELRTAEAAKRWLLFELGELGLPPEGVVFDFLSSAHEPVTTGHADGVITLDLAESDDAHRERMREEMGEPYRTVLGHLRHEIGHYFWPIVANDDAKRAAARRLFGDDTADYQAALERHYEQGPPPGWADEHVSAYATMHPMEDWAETFAHYLHIRDTLQTATAYGVHVEGEAPAAAAQDGEMAAMLTAWLPLSRALNALNRSMGRDDLYPFVLPPAVMDKLALVHELVTDR
jgi:hypothetical protein